MLMREIRSRHIATMSLLLLPSNNMFGWLGFQVIQVSGIELKRVGKQRVGTGHLIRKLILPHMLRFVALSLCALLPVIPQGSIDDQIPCLGTVLNCHKESNDLSVCMYNSVGLRLFHDFVDKHAGLKTVPFYSQKEVGARVARFTEFFSREKCTSNTVFRLSHFLLPNCAIMKSSKGKLFLIFFMPTFVLLARFLSFSRRSSSEWSIELIFAL